MNYSQEEYVCSSCFSDSGLKDFVETNAADTSCSFCGSKSDEPISAPISEVTSYMEECLHKYYDDPGNAGMAYETREGGFQGTTFDTPDLLMSADLDLPNDDGRLWDAIINGIENTLWCDNYPYSASEKDVLIWSWEQFCKDIKHNRRFFFLDHSQDPEEREIMSMGNTLKAIGHWCTTFDLNFRKEMPAA